MMNEAITLIQNDPTVTTRSLAEMLEVDASVLFDALNSEAKEGNLIRHTVYVNNGTTRPTLCFGWSCPTD